MKHILMFTLIFCFNAVFAGEPARPAVSNGYYAFIDTAGNIVIKTSLSYDSNFPAFFLPRHYTFNEGRAVVRYEDGYGIINRSGEIVFAPAGKPLKTASDDSPALYYCNWIGPFSEGRAAVLLQRKFLGIFYGGGYGFLDSSGQVVIQPRFESVGPFSEGLAPAKLKGRYGFIDAQGNVKIPFQYEVARPFSEGLALVKEDSAFYYIDHQNRKVLKVKYAHPHPYKEGLSAFREGDFYGFMNTAGEVDVPAIFQAAGDFSEGRALVKYSGKYGFIDTQGRWIIPPKFEAAASFREGLAPVKADSLWGYIDKKGAWAIEPRFDRVWQFINGLAIVWQDKTIFYMNTSGELVHILFEGEVGNSAAEKEEARVQYLLSH